MPHDGKSPRRAGDPRLSPLCQGYEVSYEVGGVSRTVTGWAKAQTIPKTTLIRGVIERGMLMAAAIKLGSRRDKKRKNRRSEAAHSRAEMTKNTAFKGTQQRSAAALTARPRLQPKRDAASASTAASPVHSSHESDPTSTDCRTFAADASDAYRPIGQNPTTANRA